MHLPIRFQLDRWLSHDERIRNLRCQRTTVKGSSGPFYGVFIFFARHLLGLLTGKKRSDKRIHGILANHCLLSGVKCAIHHVFSAGLCDACKALETRTGEPLGYKSDCEIT